MFDETIIPFEESEEPMSRYYDFNSIILFGVFSTEDARDILATKTFSKLPLKLYERPNIAKTLAMQNTNLANSIILAVAVKIANLEDDKKYYDAFIPSIVAKVKDQKINLKDCVYLREYDTKNKVIEYTINDSSIILNTFPIP